MHKSYKSAKGLRGVNREVATGSILALLGANGAGKTTLIKILSTLLKPDAGAGAVNGFSVTTAPAQVHESTGTRVNQPHRPVRRRG